MFMVDGWIVDQGEAVPIAGPAETLCWQDHATELSISTLTAACPTVGYRLRISNLAVDILPPSRIIVRPTLGLAQNTIDHFLADQVFPRLLAHSEKFVIHAGAVRIANAAVVMMGASGRGKSTLVASFDQAGLTMLGDDAMVISSLDTVPAVRSVYPSLRLFPDSIDAVMPGAVTAGPVSHYTVKERIDVAVNGAVANLPVPIHALFDLACASSNGEIVIRRLAPAQACMALVESSFALDPSDTIQARRRLDDASALARAVPAFEISYPRDYARLPEVRQAILDQVSALAPA